MNAATREAILKDPRKAKEAARILMEPWLRKGYKPAGAYPCQDENGTVLFRELRVEHAKLEKVTRPMSFNGGGWEKKLPTFTAGKPIFNIPEILKRKDENVFVVEGPKCMSALNRLGLLATTSYGGSQSANGADWRPLKGRSVVLWPDNDEPGAKYADDVTAKLEALNCRVEQLDVSRLELPVKGDVCDWLKFHPAATARDIFNLPRLTKTAPATVAPGPKPASELEAEIERLAGLSPVEYDLTRKATAREIGIRTATLDNLTDEKRKEKEVAEARIFPDFEPWPDAVDGLALLDEIRKLFTRHVILPDGAEIILPLWTLYTFVFDGFSCSPYILIKSPEKRCGKTTLLNMLGRLCNRVIAGANISPAAVYRAIEKWKPTLLIDEADTFARDNPELAGVLNSGHTKGSAFVIRCEGDNFEPKKFSTWSPKAVALIGKAADTLEDRSIIFPMRRKQPGETVERLKGDEPFTDIIRKCLRWGEDNFDALKGSDPATPTGLNDRAADNARPLLAIADLVGGTWPEDARKALLTLCGESTEDDSPGVMLLEDIKRLFEAEHTDRLTSEVIVERLAELEDRPWPEWKKGRPITVRQVARLLKPFGIAPKQFKETGEKHRGYLLPDFKDAFSRYIPIPSGTAGTGLKNKDLRGNPSGTFEAGVPDENLDNSFKNNAVPLVPDENPDIREKETLFL